MHLLFLICVAGMSTSYSITWVYFSGSFSFFDIFIPLFLLVIFLQKPQTRLKFDGVLLILLCLMLITGASSIASQLSAETPAANPLYFFRSMFFLLIYFLVLHWPVSRASIVMAVFVGMVFSIFVAIYVWTTAPRFFAFTQIPMFHVLDSPSGIRINRNQIGFCSSLAFLISAYSFLYEDLMTRRRGFLFSVFLFIFTILTFSKGAWLLLAIGTLGLVLLRYSAAKSTPRIFVLSCLAILIFAVPSTFKDSIMLRIANSGHTNDFRIAYISDAIDIGSKFPVFGIGPGNYGLVSSRAEYTATIDPHNAYLQTFSEQGIFAMFSVLLLYAVAFLKGLRYRKHDKLSNLILIVLVCLFVDGVVSGLSLSSKYLYIFLALLVAGKSRRLANEISPTTVRTVGMLRADI